MALYKFMFFILILFIILILCRKKFLLLGILIEKIGCRIKTENILNVKKINTQFDKAIEADVSRIEKEIEHFQFYSIFAPAPYKQNLLSESLDSFSLAFIKGIPKMCTTEKQIQSLLAIDFKTCPSGLDLLKPMRVDTLPSLSSNLLNLKINYYNNRVKKVQICIENIRTKIIADINRANKLKEKYNLGQQSAIEDIAKLILNRHAIPELFQQKTDVLYESNSRIILVVIEIPDLSTISIVKQKTTKYRNEWVGGSSRNQKKLKEDILYST